MSDTVRRKDVVYPTGDSHKPNGDQFNNQSAESSPSVSTQNTSEQSGNRVSISNTALTINKGNCHPSPPIQIGVGNGFSSEDSEDSDSNITMSRSCGQAELRNLKSEGVRRNSGGSTNDRKYLAGKVVEIPNDDDNNAIDKRVQSTYLLFSKGNLKSKRQTSTKNTLNVQQKERAIKPMGVGAVGTTSTRSPSPIRSKSNHSSPSHTTNLQTASFAKLRSPSPEVGKRIQSNPFFQQDRDRVSTASRTIVNALKAKERNRLGSAPTDVTSTSISSSADVSMKEHKGKSLSKSQSSDLLDVLSTSGHSADSVEPHNRKSKGTSVDVNRRHSTETTPKVSVDAAVTVNIQSRIKLWAAKEKEAKEIQMQEEQDKRRTSVGTHKQKEQHTVKDDDTLTLNDKLSHDVGKRLKVTGPSVSEGNQQTVKYEKIPIQDKDETKKVTVSGNKEGYSSSSSLGSPSRSPTKGSRSRSSSKGSKDSSSEELSPKKSRWKLRSPLLNRKRNTDSESNSMDSEQSDENVLSNKIGTRSSKKRKAIKKRLSSTFAGMLRSYSDSKQEKKSKTSDDVPTKHKEVVTEVMQRSNSVGASSRRRVNNKQKTLSQPDITRLCVYRTPHDGDALDDGVYMTIQSKQLDPETERFIALGTGNVPNGSPRQKDTQIHNEAIETTERDTVAELPSVFVRHDKGRKVDVKDRTISRDIRDIIDSLGTESLDRKESELSKEVITEIDELEDSSQLENTLLSNSPLDVFVEPPTDDSVEVGNGSLPPRVSSPNMLYLSGDSGSDEEANGMVLHIVLWAGVDE